MSFVFGKKSLERLAECEAPLQLLMLRVLEASDQDLTILCGKRGEAEQNAAYAAGNSKLKYPKSKHNKSPSQAVDVAPYPVNWKNIDAFRKLGLLVILTWGGFTTAEKEGWELSWGGSWEKFRDYPHFELRKA